jgi:hypothetical protein
MHEYLIETIAYVTILLLLLGHLYFPLMCIKFKNKVYYPMQWTSDFTGAEISSLIKDYADGKLYTESRSTHYMFLETYSLKDKLILTPLVMIWPLVFITAIVVLLLLILCMIYEYNMVSVIKSVEIDSCM